MSLSVLTDQFSALGVREGGMLLVHASLRSLGRVEGGAETVIRALLNTLGDDGTLLLPGLSYATVNQDNPHFDVRRTPVCVGALPEYFRQRAGTLRSVHPTHSVCGVGANADELLTGHDQDTTPCGPNSPFHRLPHYAGQLLFLGCGMRPNTSMHAIEELSEPPYLFGDVVDYTVTHADGRVTTMSVRRHRFDGWLQRYDRLAQLLDGDSLRTGKLLDAQCHLVETATMWTVAHEKLKANPLFFVERADR